MEKEYYVEEVFVPGGMPKLTYISRAKLTLEQDLKKVARNLCKLVTLTGSTKSGKTVLTNKIFPRTNPTNIWIDGGSIGEENDFWQFILAELDAHTSIEESTSKESNSSISGDATGEIGIPLIAKGTGKIGATTGSKSSTAEKFSRTLSPRAAAILAIRKHTPIIIIDDFHYLKRDFQGDIVRALKPLIFEGLAVVAIAIPHRRYDAVKVEKEMTQRIQPIPVPSWSKEELMEISSIGFPLLNVEVIDTVSERMAEESYGSPHLMQEFCSELARQNSIEKTLPQKITINSISDDVFRKIANNTGKVIFEKLAKGPRQRSDRKPRPLAAGGKADIYKVVLLALAKISPGMQRVNYEVLRAAIKETLLTEIPQAHEVSRVLEKMSEIASNDEASTPVIDWIKADQELYITDPFFAFFLKWGTIDD
ncbi:ATP-binding protein [Pseudomonas oryzae]|uniref:AAA domain-containing protein n=1 Tax=Pseudomonas oryzae TaxID=1392877 RepID=A0A1H1TRT3_9PSED|nr:ATP-binding protein [Pseudomonas oryzae]SDS62781.1 hypothetical protein SAMN05216221_2240 [Pseudomonas oryzae]